MRLLCSLFISNNIAPGLYSLAVFSFSLVLSCTLLIFFSFSLPLYSLDVFVLFSCTLLISYFSDEVWACVVLLQPWLQPPKKRILIMRESPPHRISTTPLLNSREKEKWEGEISQQYDEGFILVITTSTLINSENLEYTDVFESHFKKYRLIQSSLMVVERLA